MEAIHRIIIELNQSLSDYVLLFLLLGAGLWFSFKTRFVQVRFFKEGMKRFFSGLSGKKEKHEGGMSSFQALATAIAAQVGTGNIVGASGSIFFGTVSGSALVWDLSDMINQLTVLPNVLALFALTGTVGMILKSYGK